MRIEVAMRVETTNRTAEVEVADEAPDPSPTYFEIGDAVKDVEINVDHAIVKHFSEHLYSSPNKAIEELVSNGFDALATRCYVYIPGEFVPNRVVVWDNGISMGVDGIAAMWQIAKSPKEALGYDRVATAEGRRRAVIGKFGIGKLASYAVGNRISHVCRTPAGEYLAVSVDYRNFTDSEAVQSSPSTSSLEPREPTPEDDAALITLDPKSVVARHSVMPPNRTPPRASIRALTAVQAEEVVRSILPRGEAIDFMLSESHWTLAVIDDLRENKPLYPGRLSWVLGNGMPLRPDFKVWVEDEEVHPKLASNASTIWNLDEKVLQDALKGAWDDAVAHDRVSGDIDLAPPELDPDSYEATEPNANQPAITLPVLGRVTATVRLFEDSLAAQAGEGRSHGFFLMVRGRLVNPDDDKIFLHDPSFGTFYRSQFIICADGVDAELLADRESLRRDTAMTRELQVLQGALYRAARVAVTNSDEVKASSARPESRLPVRSRELFRDPMAALFSRSATRPTSINLDEPVIDRKALGESETLAVLEGTTGHLQVNSTHPFYKAVENQAGGGKRGAAVMRAFDLFAVAERLTEGFLYGRGLPEDQVQDIIQWRDRLLRSLALGYDRNPDDAILELRTSSVAGSDRFEIAIAELFRLMGFTATRDGAPGQKDVLVVAPVGPGHKIFVIEGKGSAGPVDNVPAAVASAASHRDKVEGATHAIIVARAFSGFEQKDEPAILEECRAVRGVSLVTVETLVSLYESLLKYAYPLETIMDALFELESPTKKLARVAELQRPLHEFGFREVLDEIWERQSGDAMKDLVDIRSLWQARSEWRYAMDLSEFTSKLTALSHFAGRLMVLDTVERAVHITQHPEFVASHVARALNPPIVRILGAEQVE